MSQIHNLLEKWNVSAYFHGHHHTLAYYLTNNNATLHVQSGAGGNIESACAPLAPAPGQEISNTFGFVHARLDKHELTVDFVTDMNVLEFSVSMRPRTPAVGVVADRSFASEPNDPAVHFCKTS